MRKLALVAALALAAATGRAADSPASPWAYCDPGARLLAGIEWQRMSGSPAGDELRRKLLEAGAGPDLLDGAERIVLSSTGERRPGDERPPLLLAAEGRFDLGRLRALAIRKLPQIRFHHGVEILEEKPAPAPVAVALVSPRLILLGDAGAVRAALDSSAAGGQGLTDNPLAARAAHLAAANDVWLVARVSPGLIASNGAEETAFLAMAESAELGLSFSEGLDLKATLKTGSSDDAQKLAGGLQLLLALKTAGRVAAGGQDPTRNLQIFTDGPLVEIALRMSEEELRAALREAEPAILAAIAPARGDSAEDLPPTEPRRIRIYGLAEGVREIPFGR
jgi:hypothetical protein